MSKKLYQNQNQKVHYQNYVLMMDCLSRQHTFGYLNRLIAVVCFLGNQCGLQVNMPSGQQFASAPPCLLVICSNSF